MSFVNNQLIECIRASSEEAKTQTNKNLADYTNKLGQALKLEVGDILSVERAFINGLGAGNQDSIQFSGRRVIPYKNRKIKYSKLTGSQPQTNSLYSPYKMDFNLEQKVEELETDNLVIKDNECKYSIGYYINSCNHPSYIQLPRRFTRTGDGSTIDAATWVDYDSINQGLPQYSIDPKSYCQSDWRFAVSLDSPVETIYKQRVDNSRFTLFLRSYDFAAYEVKKADGSRVKLVDDAKIDLIDNDPRNLMSQDYIRYRELKTMKINEGFNTPESVANQIKLQMNNTEAPEPFIIHDPTKPDYKRVLTTRLKAETYKPFNVASYYHMSETNYNSYLTYPTLTNENLSYFSNYWAVGIKRPEIYEAGVKLPKNGTVFASMEQQPAGQVPNNYDILTTFELTQDNVDLFLSLFDAEALYSELWDDLEFLNDFSYQVLYPQLLPTINNSRFLHMSRYGHADYPAGIPHKQTTFGNDGMDKLKPAENPASAPIFFEYDDTQRNLKVPTLDTLKRGKWDRTKLIGGFVIPYYNSTEDKCYIAFKMEALGGVPNNFFTGKKLIANDIIWGGQELHVKDPALDALTSGRYIGYDRSCTAFSTAMILPYSSHTPTSFEGLPDDSAHSDLGVLTFDETAIIDTIDKYTQAYLGANNPILSYDEVAKRFSFSQLHISENVGNRYNAGDDGGVVPIPINADAGDVVYKINPHIDYAGFSPTMKPYTVDAVIQFRDPYEANEVPPEATTYDANGKVTPYGLRLGAELNQRVISLSNENIEPYNIFDAWGGIYFDDMGYNIEEWENDSMWGRMGFSWEQFNSPVSAENTLANRVNQDNRDNLYRPTTNAEVDTTDTKAFIVNLYGAPQYSTMIGAPSVINTAKWKEAPNSGAQPSWDVGPQYPYYPPLSQKTSSQTLPAKNLPKSMIYPFYTIRSNILGDTNYLGSKDSGMRLPVCGIVDRYGAQSDFYFGSPSDLNFTITKQTNISDIQTAICNPDGTYANIDANSGVIYKIQREMPAPKNIIEELIQEEKKSGRG